MAKRLGLLAFFLMVVALCVGFVAIPAASYPGPFSPEIENGLTTLGVVQDLPPPTMDKIYVHYAISKTFDVQKRIAWPTARYAVATFDEISIGGYGETTAIAMMNGGGLFDSNYLFYSDGTKNTVHIQSGDQEVARSAFIVGDAIAFAAPAAYTVAQMAEYAALSDWLTPTNTSNLTVWYYHTGKKPPAGHGNNHDNTPLPSTFGNDVAVTCDNLANTMAV